MLDLLPSFYNRGDDFLAWKFSQLRFPMKAVSYVPEPELSADVTFIELQLQSETIRLPLSDIRYVEVSQNSQITIISLKLHDKVLSICIVALPSFWFYLTGK